MLARPIGAEKCEGEEIFEMLETGDTRLTKKTNMEEERNERKRREKKEKSRITFTGSTKGWLTSLLSP